MVGAPLLNALEDRHPDALSVEIARLKKLIGAHGCMKFSVGAVHVDDLLSARP